MRPGTMVLARRPWRPYWVATYLVNVLMPAFDTLYAVLVMSPLSAAPDDMFTMAPPPRASRWGIACLHVSIWLRRLTDIIWSHTSMAISATAVSRASTWAAVSAALLSTMSM